MRRKAPLGILALTILLTAPCTDQAPQQGTPDAGESRPDLGTHVGEGPPQCAHYNPLRNLYFGDLHAHTALSFDAWGYGVRVTPAEAYAFAQGGSVMLPPLGDGGRGTREVRLERPLDFAVVSDHGEFLGEVSLCTTPGSPAYDREPCVRFRGGGDMNVAYFGMRLAEEVPSRIVELCGEDNALCLEEAKVVWQSMVEAADQAQDKTEACLFTSLVGYEYTSSLKVTNLHRVVVFKDLNVPELPITAFEEPTPLGLWRALDQACLQAGTGCDLFLLPHNSNWSNGRMYTPDYGGSEDLAEQREVAELRIKLEVATEIFQHKGDMECSNGFDDPGAEDDPYCDFERLRQGEFDDCGEGTGQGGVQGMGCVSRLDYLRPVFKEGLAEKKRLGVNPYRFAVVAATDTHNGTPGMVEEAAFPGHVGTADDTAARRLGEGTLTHKPKTYNPGGLAAVWATENSREALFDAIKRGETYGTSGPRMEVRFFGGWDLAEDLCGSPDMIARADEEGAPMGGDLPGGHQDQKPAFLAYASHDPGTAAQPGAKLQALQIIKGWLDGRGERWERVYTVAGSAEAGATVDQDCSRQDDGSETLCALWRDPDFDPAQPAFYYLRVLETPVCRWSGHDCLSLPPEDQPASCIDPAYPRVIQERAWTSPIWYEGT